MTGFGSLSTDLEAFHEIEPVSVSCSYPILYTFSNVYSMYADIVLCLDSTRKLYEKKLAEAMAKNPKPSSDKTFYREERNSLTVIKHTVLKHHIPILGTCSDLVDPFFVFHRGRNHVCYISSTSKFE